MSTAVQSQYDSVFYAHPPPPSSSGGSPGCGHRTSTSPSRQATATLYFKNSILTMASLHCKGISLCIHLQLTYWWQIINQVKPFWALSCLRISNATLIDPMFKHGSARGALLKLNILLGWVESITISVDLVCLLAILATAVFLCRFVLYLATRDIQRIVYPHTGHSRPGKQTLQPEWKLERT